jgi:hypothetical protein
MKKEDLCEKDDAATEKALSLLRVSCFPEPPIWLESRIMAQVYAEEERENAPAAAGFSTWGWVLAGCIMLISLSTVGFGMTFGHIASLTGSSFLLPMGIISGCIITAYGALFIGSHLQELSARLRIR